MGDSVFNRRKPPKSSEPTFEDKFFEPQATSTRFTTLSLIDRANISSAISLKRIADTMEKNSI